MMPTKAAAGQGRPASRPDYIIVGKGRTELHIPGCQQALDDSSEGSDDSLEDTAWTSLTTQSDHPAVSDSGKKPQTGKQQEAQSRLPACKRKLALECESLSDRETPKRSTPNFKSLQAFWENKSGGAIGDFVELDSIETVAEISGDASTGVKACKSVQTTVSSVSKAPVDKANFSYIERLSNAQTEPLDLTKAYTDVVTGKNSDKVWSREDNVNDCEKSGKVVNKDLELETPDAKLSLSEFKNMDSVNQREKPEPSDAGEPGCSVMPPPSDIPACLSSSQKPDRRTSARRKDRCGQTPVNKFANEEFSPDDLLPKDRPQRGRKAKSKRRLLSLDPEFYSPPFSDNKSDVPSDNDGSYVAGTAAVSSGDVATEAAETTECRALVVSGVGSDLSVRECDIPDGSVSYCKMEDTSVWSDEAESFVDSVIKPVSQASEVKISIAGISPILPDRVETQKPSVTFELLGNDMSCTMSFNDADQVHLSDVEDAIKQKVRGFVDLGSINSETSLDYDKNVDKHGSQSQELKKCGKESQPDQSPKTLKTLCVEGLGTHRSKLYSVLKDKKTDIDHLSVPVSVDIPGEVTCNAEALKRAVRSDSITVANEDNLSQGEKEHSLNNSVARVFDPCWSPDLSCPESPSDFSPPVTRTSNLVWSPTFSDADISPLYSTTDMSQDKVGDLSVVVTPCATENRKRPRCLDMDTAVNQGGEAGLSPSPKMSRPPSNDELFYPVKQDDVSAAQTFPGDVPCVDQSSYVGDSTEDSFRLYIATSSSSSEDDTLRESLTTSSGSVKETQSDSSVFSTSCDNDSVTDTSASTASSSSVSIISASSTEMFTPPVYPQFLPEYWHNNNSSHLSGRQTRPVNPVCPAYEEYYCNDFRGQSPYVGQYVTQISCHGSVTAEVVPGDHMTYSYDPLIGMLEENDSVFWKEIGVNGTNYSRIPSYASSVYAYHTWSNSLTDQADHYLNINKPSPIKSGYLGIGVAPVHDEPTVSVLETRVLEESLFGSTVSYMVEKPVTEAVCVNSPVSAAVAVNQPVRTVLPVTAGVRKQRGQLPKAANKKTDGRSDNLFELMDSSVRQTLEKENGSFNKATSSTFELDDHLKCIRPYVISGSISSTYLMAMLNKTDLVNDMFLDAFDDCDKIKDWVLENCRKTTPAILAKDLIFRLFTLDELDTHNLTRTLRTKKITAVRLCLASVFPDKFSAWHWKSKCLPYIKNSIKTLFKHRVRQVQCFYEMHKKFLN